LFKIGAEVQEITGQEMVLLSSDYSSDDTALDVLDQFFKDFTESNFQ
jgi:hypothetical protein